MTARTRTVAAPGITARDIGEIHYYLSQSPRQLPSRLLYDNLGSSLFIADATFDTLKAGFEPLGADEPYELVDTE